MADFNTCTEPQQARRDLFPRGLAQPGEGFRFGADTLLLAAYAARHLPAKASAKRTILTGLELGCGCGAASLGLALLRPELPLHITGIDTGPEMVDAANQNAATLGFDSSFHALAADVRDYRWLSKRGANFVLANPPFRLPGTGRRAATPEKDRARFEGPGGFVAFAHAAARCLRTGGLFFLVHLAERLPDLLRDLQEAGLAPECLQPVQGNAGTQARLVLIQARQGGHCTLTLEPALVLYDQDATLSHQAATFCPFLTTNPHRRAGNSGESPC